MAKDSYAGTILTGPQAGDYRVMDCPCLRVLDQTKLADPREYLNAAEAVSNERVYRHDERTLYVAGRSYPFGFWLPEGRHWSDAEIVDELIAGYRRPL